MNLQEQRIEFEKNKRIYESVKLKFIGVEGFDVYNTSIPFTINGKEYIYGRVEKREEWACSWVRLFERIEQDVFKVIPESMIYQLEDPFVQFIGGELVMGGTHVRKEQGNVQTYYAYFYRGTGVNDLAYYTTGPDGMKDIRLIELADGRIGVFSRPRSEETRKKYGSESVVGFTIIHDLSELTDKVVENAPVVAGIIDKEEWGGCNQCYLLESGRVGVIGHKCYHALQDQVMQAVYLNVAFIFDPETRRVSDMKIIGTRPCYPAGPAKKTDLRDCAFTAGIVMRKDGRVDLYSGISDTEAGRIVIDYPFGDDPIKE